MAIETVILYILSVTILWGIFLNPNSGLEATFRNAGPRLGYKIEKHIETGSGFTNASQNTRNPIDWSIKRGGRYNVEGLGE